MRSCGITWFIAHSDYVIVSIIAFVWIAVSTLSYQHMCSHFKCPALRVYDCRLPHSRLLSLLVYCLVVLVLLLYKIGHALSSPKQWITTSPPLLCILSPLLGSSADPQTHPNISSQAHNCVTLRCLSWTTWVYSISLDLRALKFPAINKTKWACTKAKKEHAQSSDFTIFGDWTEAEFSGSDPGTIYVACTFVCYFTRLPHILLHNSPHSLIIIFTGTIKHALSIYSTSYVSCQKGNLVCGAFFHSSTGWFQLTH